MALEDRDYMKGEGWQRRQRERLAEWQWRKFSRPWPAATPRQRLTRYALVATVTLVPGAAVGYAAGAEIGPFAPEPLLVWGGERFDSRAEFVDWLELRGGSYARWAAQHPAAAAKLDAGP